MSVSTLEPVPSASQALVRVPSVDDARDPVGAYFGQRENLAARLKNDLMLRLLLHGQRLARERPLALGARPSPHLPDLQEIVRAVPDQLSLLRRTGHQLLVGSVRMGYGHHRLAYAVITWAQALGARPILHDLLAIDCPEAEAVRGIDATYSRLSRLAADLGGLAERAWGRLMAGGDLDSLRVSWRLAERVRALMADLPRDLPVITTYPMNGQIAVQLGFTRVINLVVDNHPQYFTLVPGALNLVQSPSYHTALLEMGLPPSQVACAGHWVSHDLAVHAAADARARIARAELGCPRRLLIPVGGAGAQAAYLCALVRGLLPLLERGRAQLVINAGDHLRAQQAFASLLTELGLPYRALHTAADVDAFCAGHPLDGPAPAGMLPVTLASFASHHEAFTATDRLIRVCDVLVTKPSELAFFPVPKLHIRRVGDHEAASARRSAELGDGTLECREVADALRMAQLLVEQDELFVRMNQDIARHAGAGVYDGARVAVEHALAGQV